MPGTILCPEQMLEQSIVAEVGVSSPWCWAWWHRGSFKLEDEEWNSWSSALLSPLPAQMSFLISHIKIFSGCCSSPPVSSRSLKSFHMNGIWKTSGWGVQYTVLTAMISGPEMWPHLTKDPMVFCCLGHLCRAHRISDHKCHIQDCNSSLWFSQQFGKSEFLMQR